MSILKRFAANPSHLVLILAIGSCAMFFSTSASAQCWAPWSASTAYNGGAQVSYNNENYQAAFWTQNQEPDLNSGPAGSGQPWIPEGSCGSSTPSCTPNAITPYIQVNSGSWVQTASATVSAGASVNLGPQPTSGTWSWTGPNGYTSTSRQIGLTINSSSTYTATYTNSCGAQSTQAFSLTVSGSATPTPTPGCTPNAITPYIQVNSGSWQQTASATVSAGSSVNLGPQPTSGTWSWTGPNGYTSTSRQIGLTVNSSSTYTATYTNSCGSQSSQAFTLTVPTPTPACTPNAITPYIQVNNGSWQQTASATVSAGASVNLGPQPTSGTWSWTGPNGYTSTSRQIGLIVNSSSTYTATYTNSCGAQSTQAFSLSVSSSGGPSGFIFSAYKDVTVNANWNTGGQQTDVTGSVQPVTSVMPQQSETWAFATGTCGSENWGGMTPAEEASNVQSFVSVGKYYMVGTGGAGGSFDCPSGSSFTNFIQTYYSANMLGVDFDIEVGQNQTVVDDLINSAAAAEASYPNMRFSFTIATLGGTSNPDLGSEGVLVVNEIKRLGLGGNYTVNLMVMDYGGATSSVCDVVNGVCEMGQSAITAAQALNSQFGIPYGHMELTPDIGQNDTQGEIFTLSDVDTMTSWMKANGLAGAHFWAFDRDTPTCSGGSNTCNGTGDPSLAFTNRFKSDLGVN